MDTAADNETAFFVSKKIRSRLRATAARAPVRPIASNSGLAGSIRSWIGRTTKHLSVARKRLLLFTVAGLEETAFIDWGSSDSHLP
ncbi:hypothetical protein PBRA_000031 [Plasmodiophora brassicae]|uniref:Uncharacterized protein n=1 Tax=Plasmodiophora brassicae TaxID=37360 RepID=A0A0G4IGD7_PLABS|nr:hypothetical protein PBRA_000031 [Plasmodiophora brassicae]